MIEHHLEQGVTIQASVHSQRLHQHLERQRLAALGRTDKLLGGRHLLRKRLRLMV